MNVIQVVLVVFIAFLADMEDILGQWQFHQPIISCTLVGLVTGNLAAGVMLGGTLQFIAMGRANIGATVASGAALAGIASTIIMVQGYLPTNKIGTAVGIAVPLAITGLGLTVTARALAVAISYIVDRGAEKANYQEIGFWRLVATGLQGLGIAIPAALLLTIPSKLAKSRLSVMPVWPFAGMTIGGGMVVAVDYAIAINMMTNKEVGPLFTIEFALATVQDLTLIALGTISTTLALMYLALEGKGSNNLGSKGAGDPSGDILDNY